MEQHISIPTTDNFEVHGILNWAKKSERLVIFVHGLSGDMYEPHYYAGKQYFTQYSYEVFRFNFYDGRDTNRDLAESSITTHSQDLDAIVTYFEDKYSEVYILSHSLGWPSVIGMKYIPKNIKKLIFWDPGFDFQNIEKKFLKCGNTWLFLPGNGKHLVVSEAMIQDRKRDHIWELEAFNFPRESMHIIFAGGHTKIQIKPQIEHIWISSSTVEWANHGFTQEGKYEELFETTRKFIES